jgi:hypothetical protein
VNDVIESFANICFDRHPGHDVLELWFPGVHILDPEHLRRLLRLSRQLGVRLPYRYHLDVETAARTIWTGLHTARTNGFSAGKYGLVPMTLEQQGAVIEMITRWTADLLVVSDKCVTRRRSFSASFARKRAWLLHEFGQRLSAGRPQGWSGR